MIMKRKYAASAWSVSFACVLLSAAPAIAQTSAGGPVSLPLSALVQGKKVTVLRSGHETAQVVWKIEPHYNAQDAALQIRYLTSPDTTAGSQLVVSVDHRIIGAVSLNPELPRGSFTVLLGRHVFTAGAYPLEIQALPGPGAHHTQAGSTGAWTQIDYSASQLTYTPRRIPWHHLDFSRLPGMLNESALDGVLPLPVQFYGAANPTLLTAAQEAVAGLALRTSALLHVEAQMGPVAATTPAASSDLGVSAMMGKSSALPATLQPRTPITGPTVLLAHDPGNPLGVILIFTGTNDAQVLEAAKAFAVNRTTLPLGHRWSITGSDQQMAALQLGPQDAAYPGEKVSLRDLQGPDSPLNTPHGTADIAFWMPGGLFASRQSNLKMKLTMATEPLTKSASRPIITVMANHHWISEWKLTPGVANYQTTIPFSALVGGENHITFDIAGGKVSVFPESTLQLPATHRYAVLPDFTLFRSTGFPLVVHGAGRNLSVWYSERTLSNWSAGLTLFGRLAQVAHSPLSGTQATFSMPDAGNVLAIGTLSSVPASWLSASPVRLQQNGMEWQLSARQVKDHPWIGATQPQATAYLMESRTPYKGHVAVTFLAKDTQGLTAAAWNLVAPSSWGKLQGDLAWQNSRGTYVSTMVGPHFMYGDRHSGWFWIFLFSVRPWLWVLAGSTAVLFATLTAWIYTLRKKAQWRAEEAL